MKNWRYDVTSALHRLLKVAPQEDIREVVAYAKERMIEIISEIEIPGHETAMLAAYPQVGCGNEPVEVETKGGIFDKLICVGKEESFSFVTKVLDELVELFPYEMIHIGGDEACKCRWRDCPDCQQKIRQPGLKDENALQQWFVVRVQEYLKKKGKILNTEVCPDYLDEKAVMGVECPLWMERVTDMKRLFHLMLPRLPAMAEHHRVWYIPENQVEFAKQEEMMAQERAIYGDERGE